MFCRRVAFAATRKGKNLKPLEKKNYNRSPSYTMIAEKDLKEPDLLSISSESVFYYSSIIPTILYYTGVDP